MTWWKASSVTVTAGQSTVTVNTGDDIGMIKGAEGLVVGNQPPVEIKRSYLNASVMMLELMAPWPYANQSGQPAIAFPTDGDLAAATAVLKQLIDGFAKATQAQAEAGLDNEATMTSLRTKQAILANIQNGSNPVGSYTLFPDGTAFARKRVEFSGVSINPANGTNSNTGANIDITSPISFVAQSFITIGNSRLVDASGELLYSSVVSNGGGGFSLLNLGLRPVESWPSHTSVGPYVAVSGFCEVLFFGRWL